MSTKLSLLLLILLLPLMVSGAHIREHFEGDNITRLDHVDLVEEVLVVRRVLEPSIFVAGTEYAPFDPGKVFVQLSNESNGPLNDASCFLDVFFPNGTTFITDLMMNFLAKGIYDHDFTIPPVLGVYPVSVECIFQTTTTTFGADGFVAYPNVTTGDGLIGLAVLGDGNELKGDEKADSQRRTGLNISIPVNNISSLLALSLNVHTEWRESKGGELPDDITYSFRNFSDVGLPGVQVGSHGYNADIEEFTFTLLGNVSDFYNGTHFVVVINDTIGEPNDTDNSHLHIDFLRLLIARNTTTVVEHLRGGGELHVTNGTANVLAAINEPLMFDLEEVLLLLWFFLLAQLVFVNNRMYWFGVGFYTLFLGIAFITNIELIFLICLIFAAIAILLGGVIIDFESRQRLK